MEFSPWDRPPLTAARPASTMGGENALWEETDMDIQGLQKMTLLDYPGRVACTVFLGGCDLRCPFCHNGGLVLGPMPRPDLPELLSQIKELGYPVKLDTNGGRPAQLRALAEAGLVDYVAMDVKNSPGRYGETAGVPGLDLAPFRESVSFLLQGTVDYEFRTTVVREFHDADSFKAIGPWIAGAKRYFLQSFVDRDTVLREGLHPWDGETLGSFADLVRPYVEQVELRGV